HQTTLGELQPGNRVNLEPAATPTTRLGGHWVNGHIDPTLPIRKIEIQQPAYLLLDIPESHIAYCVPKGSITLDGIGLTIQQVVQNQIRIGLISHTLAGTTLMERKGGDRLNIEFDILAKYVFEYLKKTGTVSQPGTGISEKLRQAGFM
ncbi:MAG: riboflavin synthase, partial [Candidatus Delongbacteria bacterium]|nr:riboflavin synthase [Candidatus Delongbacteria bacterium]